MRRVLVIADPHGETQHTIRRAVALAARLDARLDVVGFVYEHLGNLPGDFDDQQLATLRTKLVNQHLSDVDKAVKKAVGERPLRTTVEVHWEKRVGDWVNRSLKQQLYDLVIKGAHRSETLAYTSTDWQLLRGSPAAVLLLAEKRWKKGAHVMAAIDLGTRSRSKMKLNYKVVESAYAMSEALRCRLHVAYAIPFSVVLRDLDMLDKERLRSEGKKRAERFRQSLADRGIEVEKIHVRTGAPEKVLVSQAASLQARLVVLGCVGRKNLAGRVIGNTAEKILRLLKADVMAIKP